jgi:S-adenosylmethionine decarboxylase
MSMLEQAVDDSGHDLTRDTEPVVEPVADSVAGEPSDHFVHRDGVSFAGTHLLLDLWGAQHLGDADFIEATLRQATAAAGAELLHIHLHSFSVGGGVSGVAVLAESHISVHTWPERSYAAFDVFMCGETEPEKAVRVIEVCFQPERSSVVLHRRGVVER